MTTKIISERYSDDYTKKAIVGVSVENQCYFVDFYDRNTFLCSRWYPGDIFRSVEDVAEEYVLGILELKENMNVDRKGNL